MPLRRKIAIRRSVVVACPSETSECRPGASVRPARRTPAKSRLQAESLPHQDLHATTGRSRELFANARTVCTCCRLTDGNHSKNSSMVEPWSRCSNSAATGRRVPLKHHVPLSLPGLRSTAGQRLQSILSVYRRRMGRCAALNRFVGDAEK
jgi:hypothetical protein